MYAHNSTIKIKLKDCIRCGKPSRIFSKGMCEQCSKIERVFGGSSNKDVDASLKDLITDCDAIFSTYIRLKYTDEDGFCECFTCGERKRWEEQQCGHYIGRGSLYLRFDPRNCRVQDSYCNELKHGDMAEFTKRLEAEHPGITDILIEESSIIYKPSRSDLKGLITEYTSKVKLLKQKLK
jgi:hypothetical protein